MKKKIEERERGKLFPSFLKLWRAIFVKDVISKILLLSFIFSTKKRSPAQVEQLVEAVRGPMQQELKRRRIKELYPSGTAATE